MVLPFRVNRYVLDELIDWDAAPDDPLYRTFFPRPELLAPELLAPLVKALSGGATDAECAPLVRRARTALNPNPAGQLDNVPTLDGERLVELQHKYRETVLYFPSQGQQCHVYCAYCFRWSQFVPTGQPRFTGARADRLAAYVARHPEVQDVLFTGGDPLFMRTAILRRHILPLLRIPHLRTVRIGTKALAAWPARFTTGADADDLMRLLEEVRDAGKHVAIVGHSVHPRELGTATARAAARRLASTGASLWGQGPILRGVNDDGATLADLWRAQVSLGIRPYYAFVARNTGAERAFTLPLRRALDVVQSARRRVSGLARAARGPVMSSGPGKVLLQGTARANGEDALVLSLLQARDPALVGATALATGPADATWLDQLRPIGSDFFPWEQSIRSDKHAATTCAE
jgi:KamA family protein